MTEVGIIDFLGDGIVIQFPLGLACKRSRKGLTELWVYTMYKTWLPTFVIIPLPFFDEWWP